MRGAGAPGGGASPDPRLGPSVGGGLDSGGLALLGDMFEVRPNNRAEFVHAADGALAFANAVERDDMWGRTLLARRAASDSGT